MGRRIAHVISTPRGVGGAERVLEALVAGSAARGIDVRVLNPFDEEPEQSALASMLGARYRARRRPRLSGLPGARRWLRAELEAFEPEIVHAHLFHAAALVASLPRGVGGRRLLSQHHGDYFAWLGRPWLQRIDDQVVRRFDIVAPCSYWVAANLPVAASKVRVVHNGWSGTPRIAPVRQHATKVVCVANLRREKDHATLIRAFRAVVEVRPDARLVLAGEGPLRRDIESQVATLGLGDSVEMRGAVANVWDVLAEADIFALSSAFEPLGIAVIEAMAAGLPVVATAVGGIPELVRSDETGLLVPAGDSVALANAILRLLDDGELRHALGVAGHEVAASLHVDHMVEAYHGVYDEVVSGVVA